MSYDIDLVIDTGAGRMATAAEIGNYTWNCRPMFEAAAADKYPEIQSPHDLIGKTGAEALPILAHIVSRMEADPATYEAMNPDNGWGSYKTWLPFLRKWRDACAEHPATIVNVC